MDPNNQATSLIRESSLVGREGLIGGTLPISRSTLWRWVNDGRFPKPLKLSNGVSAWRLRDVEAWIASKESVK